MFKGAIFWGANMLFDAIFHNLIWTEGIYIFLFTVIAGIILYKIYPWLTILAVGFFLFSFYFFRNPERVCPATNDPKILVCPADGHVVAIETIDDPTAGTVQKISIFLSPLDVHVQWTPIAGTIEQVNYRPGKFIVAYAPKSSEINERNDIIIATADNQKILVRQIAGIVARRICCWVHGGEQLPACSKYGMIRFGSRVDTLLPLDTKLDVAMGQYVYGGQTVLGKLS
jgi:phosphatidylserine decarboxylase